MEIRTYLSVSFPRKCLSTFIDLMSMRRNNDGMLKWGYSNVNRTYPGRLLGVFSELLFDGYNEFSRKLVEKFWGFVEKQERVDSG